MGTNSTLNSPSTVLEKNEEAYVNIDVEFIL
jgi:hypothetical protein